MESTQYQGQIRPLFDFGFTSLELLHIPVRKHELAIEESRLVAGDPGQKVRRQRY